MSTIHGTSTYLTPTPAGYVASAEFMDFAPCCLPGIRPCNGLSCSNDALKKRYYAHVYENRLEYSNPCSPFACLTTELCIQDNVVVRYFDKPPARAGLAPFPFCCLPCTCCGPPVVFVYKPKVCCMDMTYCFGEQIMFAPCNLFGLKSCLCFGNPCYASCSMPLIYGVKNGDVFLSAMKYAVNDYKNRTGLTEAESAIFENVEDNIFNLGAAKGIQTMSISRK